MVDPGTEVLSCGAVGAGKDVLDAPPFPVLVPLNSVDRLGDVA